MADLPTTVLHQPTLAAIEALQPGGALVARVVQLYLGELPRYRDALTSTLAGADLPALARAAHTLKSSSANVGLLRLAEIARDLESRARTGDAGPQAGLRELIDREFDRAREALEDYLVGMGPTASPKG